MRFFDCILIAWLTFFLVVCTNLLIRVGELEASAEIETWTEWCPYLGVPDDQGAAVLLPKRRVGLRKDGAVVWEMRDKIEGEIGGL